MATSEPRPARVLVVDPAHPASAALAEAAAVIRRGGLVAFPTETVYGLGANALDADAVARIFGAKERPGYNPLIVHVADADAARELAAEWPDAARELAARYWPGPITLVLRKHAVVPDLVTAGLPTVALRVPAHPVALALLRAAGCPIAAPSANRFTELSPTTASHVAASLGDRVDLILDGGPTTVGIESSVVDLTGPLPRLLRPGLLSSAELARVVGPLEVAVAEPTGEAPRPAPGMFERHYAPRAQLFVVPDDDDAIRGRLATEVAAGRQVGLLLRRPFGGTTAQVMVLPEDAPGYARQLYAALHDLDAMGCNLVLVAEVPITPAWAGIRDRLTRAAQE